MIRVVGIFRDEGYGPPEWSFIEAYDEVTGDGPGDPSMARFDTPLSDQTYRFMRGIVADCSDCLLDGERYELRVSLQSENCSYSASDRWHFIYNEAFGRKLEC